jgi:uncharacterized protein YgiM (DUF1202 family)
MFKLSVATLAAMYLIAVSVGDAPESEAVSRGADPAFETTFVSLVGAAEASTFDPTAEMVEPARLSDAEAIELALATGADLRRGRENTNTLLGTGAVQQVAALNQDATAAPATEYWSVTGNAVNLRAGPGTANDVVAKLSVGTEAEVLEEGNGWYRIRTADGATDGWIFGKYLSKNG